MTFLDANGRPVDVDDEIEAIADAAILGDDILRELQGKNSALAGIGRELRARAAEALVQIIDIDPLNEASILEIVRRQKKIRMYRELLDIVVGLVEDGESAGNELAMRLPTYDETPPFARDGAETDDD